MHRSWDIRLQKCRDLENRVRGPSRSLEISPVNRAHTTSYSRSIVTMALSRVVSEIFNVKNVVTLKSGSEVSQGHRKSYHSIDGVW